MDSDHKGIAASLIAIVAIATAYGFLSL
ncbi:hypothetical protein IBTHAUMO2_320027 [Nitrosopumilaceae archaeon]|nr:hypothetical protein IBTHAUMO2_320027 [Nitrosopumilaceae archaeon]